MVPTVPTTTGMVSSAVTRNLVLHGLWITRLALRGVEAALAAAAEHPHIDEPLPTQPGYSLADVDAALDKLWSETGRRPS